MGEVEGQMCPVLIFSVRKSYNAPCSSLDKGYVLQLTGLKSGVSLIA